MFFLSEDPKISEGISNFFSLNSELLFSSVRHKVAQLFSEKFENESLKWISQFTSF